MFRVLPLALALAAALLPLPPAHAAPLPAQERTVILISIDGFPAWLWRDPTLPIPNLRRLAAQGAVAESMVVSNPSITWINHTTLVTGVPPRKHGVLFNGLLVRNGVNQPPAIEQWADKASMVHVPTLYDVAYGAGLKTAEVDWVAILNSGTIDYEFLEMPKAGGTIEKEMVDAGIVTAADILNFRKSNIAWRDHVWTQAGVHILKQHKPNLLLFHLLTTDASNHSYGPGSTASYTAFAYADMQVGELLRAVEAAGMKERTTFLIATDHGFKKVKKTIDMNVPLKEAGLIRVEGTKVKDCDAYAMPQGGLCFVYITDPAKKAELLPKLKALCAGIEGVDQVLDAATEAPKLGMPTPAENQGMGDLVLYAKPTYAFKQNGGWDKVVADSTNYLGTHGYLNTDPELEGIFIASGYGIQPGAKLGKIVNLDVAPTAAKLLGITLKDIDGKPLEAAFAPER